MAKRLAIHSGGTEPEQTAPFCKGLVELGAQVVVLAGSGMSSGWPDRLVIHADWKGFIEFKGPRTPLRKNQEVNIREVMRRGFPAVVVRFKKGQSEIDPFYATVEMGDVPDGPFRELVVPVGGREIDFDGSPGQFLMIVSGEFRWPLMEDLRRRYEASR